MKHDEVYVGHILDAIGKIEKYVLGLSYEEFIANDMVFDAVLREMQIIGEAAKRLSEEFKQKASAVPWNAIVGFRNRAVHEYFDVNAMTVWETIDMDLPALKTALANY